MESEVGCTEKIGCEKELNLKSQLIQKSTNEEYNKLLKTSIASTILYKESTHLPPRFEVWRGGRAYNRSVATVAKSIA